MTGEIPVICVMVHDDKLKCWLYSLLEHSYRLVTAEQDNEPTGANLYLLDEYSLAIHLSWLQTFRHNVTPDSPPVILIEQAQECLLPTATLALVDARFSAQLSPEVLREQLLHWLHLQASAKLWLEAASPASHPPPRSIETHPVSAPSCSINQLKLSTQCQGELLFQLFDSLSQGVFLSDMEGKLLAVNEAFCQLTGYDCGELIGQPSDMLLPLHAQGELAADFRHLIHEHTRWEGELSGCRKGGEILPLWLLIQHITTTGKRAVTEEYFLGIVTDLRTSRQLEESVLQLSRTDSLSDLNRVLLEDRLALDIRQAELLHNNVAYIRIHLSRFRTINEHYGRAIGDWVLMAQMQRLQNLVGGRGLASRLAENEYAIIMPKLTNIAPALALAEEIVTQLSLPLPYGSREIISLPLVGVSDYPEQGNSAAELMQQAELALDWCRQQPPLAMQRFNRTLSIQQWQQNESEQALRNALLNNEFFLVYQPQLDIRQNRIVGVEALIRWRKPDRVVPPGEFIPLAEKNGLIVPISNWVLKTACQQAADWQRQGFNLHMAVNLSAQHFQHVLLVEQVAQCLQASGLSHDQLELEVTESCIMTDVDSAIRTLQALKQLGIGLSVDDFGTGYSSLNYLKMFPLDKLKIDQSFIKDFLLCNSDAVIVRAIIALGHAMGLTVIAEGVESEEQYHYLQALHCNELQGFWFSYPLLPEQIPELLIKERAGQLKGGSNTNESNVPALLLVDDEPSILHALKRTLRSSAYRIITASGAAQALDQLAHHSVGVIISDSRMPEVSGIELLRQVKECYPHVTRIMLSGYADLTALSAAINSGEIFRFIGKPWEEEELKAAVQAGFQKFDELRHQGKILF